VSAKAVQRAEEIAEEVLFPAAAQVDAGRFDPTAHLDLLAAEGFYGAAGPPELKTIDIPDFVSFLRVLEVLASGCLTTSFVWVQHHSAVLAVAGTDRPGVRDRWLEPLCSGRSRAGLAIGSVLNTRPPALRATAVDGGYRLDGEAAWMTGWGMVDTVFAAARDESDTAVYALVDAAQADGLAAEPLDMVAVQASRTVKLRFDGHVVPEDRIVGTAPFAQWSQRDAGTLRGNGSLALGLAGRSLKLAGAGDELTAQLNDCRDTLDTASSEQMPAARAKASEFALRAAATLAVTEGSRSVLCDQHAQRLMREAMFLLVFGSRPALRDELLTLLARPTA
jgi:alkylation response protein AidB-like acyl-CoA dehydrogenase